MVNTFLPYRDFAESARALDMRRLGKQRVEALQLLTALAGESKGWRNHPATRMWRGHEVALLRYGIAVCDAWTAHGYRDTCRDKMIAVVIRAGWSDAGDPSWLGDEAFHLSHRSNLVRKMPEWYGRLWPDVPDDLPYIWPTCAVCDDLKVVTP